MIVTNLKKLIDLVIYFFITLKMEEVYRKFKYVEATDSSARSLNIYAKTHNIANNSIINTLSHGTEAFEPPSLT